VLVGDAGHFKDPAPAQGISDALRQADRLAGAITQAFGSDAAALDEATRRWWRWRDRDAMEKYWFAQDMGRGGRLPVVFVELVQRLHDQGRFGQMVDVFNHRTRPSALLTPPRLLGATLRVSLRRDAGSRAQPWREAAELLGRQVRRERLNRRPEYAPALRATEAGAEAA
jgi:flavin-dependent dehydrogenase